MKQIAKRAQGKEWSGYKLDQLTYEKVVTLAAIEIEKERIGNEVARLQRGNFSMASGIFSRLTGMLGYTDYIVLAVRLWKRLSPIFHRSKGS